MRRALAVIGVGVALALAGCGGDDEEEPTAGGTTTQEATPTPTETATPTETPEQGGGTAAASEGKDLFTTTCGGCHTLADAGTNGQVGPVLDDVQPSKDEVLSAIESGPGQMPDGLLQGADAEAVAEYVSSVARQS